MSHPELENTTPFACEALFVSDETCRPVLTPILKATYDIAPSGELTLAEDQIPVDFVGESHGEPGESSPRLEPETAFVKPGTDAVLLGHAVAPDDTTTELEVTFQVGPLRQQARVSGDRRWESRLCCTRASEPEPFDRIPLTWERAFGGWDTRHDDPGKHGLEKRNPVGVGFRARGCRPEEGAALPNIEAPDAPVRRHRRRSRPVGFGFTLPAWEPRASLAGTYDEQWQQSRSPLLPTDFRRDFFNAAPDGLVAPDHLDGTEPVVVTNATREGTLRFRLPGLRQPQCLVAQHRVEDTVVDLNLDTIIVDTDAMKLILLWRNVLSLDDGPLDVRTMRISCANAPSRPPVPQPEDNVVPLFESGRESTGGVA